jgi:WD40 repeat protein
MEAAGKRVGGGGREARLLLRADSELLWAPAEEAAESPAPSGGAHGGPALAEPREANAGVAHPGAGALQQLEHQQPQPPQQQQQQRAPAQSSWRGPALGRSGSGRRPLVQGVGLEGGSTLGLGVGEVAAGLSVEPRGAGAPSSLRPGADGADADIVGVLGVSARLPPPRAGGASRRPTRVGYQPKLVEPEEQRLLRLSAMQWAAKQRALRQERTGEDVVAEWRPPCEVSRGGTGPHPKALSARSIGSSTLTTTVAPRALLPVDSTKFRTDEEIVTKMMMEMGSEQLKLVKRDFLENEDGLGMTQFVEVMMRYQPVKESQQGELETVAKLCEFFSQVDINGDGSMEWSEFTSYIVESSQDRDNFRVDNIKSYQRASVQPAPPATYDTRVDHVFYVEELDYLVACDTNRTMSVYDDKCRLVKRVRGHAGVVHSCAHLFGRGASSYLCTAGNDKTIGFWDTVSFSLCQQMPTTHVQAVLAWSGPQGGSSTLFSGGVDGAINAWDVDALALRNRVQGHRDIVMDLLCIHSMGVLASASLDSEIKFWDLPTQVLRKSLSGHLKGAFSLSYAPEYRFLVSAGFDHDALVWNPYVEHLICPLKGHNASLVGVKAIPETPEIITADKDGFVKIWDIRNFSCVQTLCIRDMVLSGAGAAEPGEEPEGGGTEQTLSSVAAKGSRGLSLARPARVSGAVGRGGGGRRRAALHEDGGGDDDKAAGDASPSAASGKRGGAASGACKSGAGKNGGAGAALASSLDSADDDSQALAENVRRRRNLASTVLLSDDSHVDTSTVNCFAFASKHKRIVVANNQLHCLDYDQPADPMLTDPAPTIGIVYNEAALTFTTAAGTSVKLWDAESGRLLRIYRDVSGEEITALCFDRRKRKFIVGDHAGAVTVFNLANGARMRDLPAHDSEVVALHSTEEQLIISCSWDGIIKVVDESDPDELRVVHTLNHRASTGFLLKTVPGAEQAQGAAELKLARRKVAQLSALVDRKEGLDGMSKILRDVCAMAVSLEHGLVATGALDMTVCVFRGDTGHAEALCVGHESEVSCIVFLDPLPLLATCDVSGNVFIWRVQPLATNAHFVTGFTLDGRLVPPPGAQAKRKGPQSGTEPTGAAAGATTAAAAAAAAAHEDDKLAVVAVQWMRGTMTLYTGDEQGYVRGWDLTKVVEDAIVPPRLSLAPTCASAAATAQHELANNEPLEQQQQRGQQQQQQPQQQQPQPQQKLLQQEPVHQKSSFLTEGCAGEAPPSTSSGIHETVSSAAAAAAALLNTSFRRLSTCQRRASFSSPADVDAAAAASAEPVAEVKRSPPVLLHTWRAHRGAIRAIVLIDSPPTLITSSLDKMVHVWTLGGYRMGSLHQGSSQDAYADAEWRFPVDRRGLHNQSLQRATELVAELCGDNARVPRISADDARKLPRGESEESLTCADADACDAAPVPVIEDGRVEEGKARASPRAAAPARRKPRPPLDKATAAPAVKRARPSFARRLSLTPAELRAADHLFRSAGKLDGGSSS